MTADAKVGDDIVGAVSLAIARRLLETRPNPNAFRETLVSRAEQIGREAVESTRPAGKTRTKRRIVREAVPAPAGE